MAKKNAIVVAGPNGSGKTTFALEYQSVHPFPLLSADAIAQELAPANFDEVRIKAGRIFFERLEAQIGKGESFLVESTLAGRGFQGIIQKLRDSGFLISVVFIFVSSAQACIARVRARVHKGGHPVPEQDIIRRFSRSCNNFWQLYCPLVDRWHIFYNGASQFHEVAIGTGGNKDIVDEGLFISLLPIRFDAKWSRNII